jgi:hypothetical protein
VAPAEPLKQYEEGKPREAWAPRTDVNGEVLWRVQLVALGDGEAEIIRVAVPGDPTVGQGEMVAVDRLTAQAWELDGRSGMAFRCAAQDLRHPRRPDPRPLVQQPPQDRLERVEHRARRRSPIARRLGRLDHPPHRVATDPESPGDLSLRDPIRRQCPHLRPIHRATHPFPASSIATTTSTTTVQPQPDATQRWLHFRCLEVAQDWAPRVRHCSWRGDNPFAELEKGERPRVSTTPKRRIFAGGELAQTIAAATEPWRTLFRLATVVGARESELLGLWWQDLELGDLDAATIRFGFQAAVDGQRVELKTDETRRRCRCRARRR